MKKIVAVSFLAFAMAFTYAQGPKDGKAQESKKQEEKHEHRGEGHHDKKDDDKHHKENEGHEMHDKDHKTGDTHHAGGEHKEGKDHKDVKKEAKPETK